VQDAEDKLFELKQGNTEALPAYISRFERILYEAQGQKWSKDRKIATYRQGLIPSIRKALRSQLDPPQDYPSYARMVLRLVGTARPSGFSSQKSGYNTKNIPKILIFIGLSAKKGLFVLPKIRSIDL
jgi:hypothetical protein